MASPNTKYDLYLTLHYGVRNVNILTAKERRSIYVSNERHYIDNHSAEVLAVGPICRLWSKVLACAQWSISLGTRKGLA